MTVFDIIKIYNPRSAKQVPPPFPHPRCSFPVTDIGWMETGILSISERVHFYKNNNNSTDTIYVWLMRTWRWECRLCFGGGFSVEAYCIYYLHDTLISTWVEGFTADPGTNPWAMVRPFWACTNVATPNWFTNVPVAVMFTLLHFR